MIIGIIQVIGTVLALIILIYLGVRFAIAAPEEKANIKEASLVYFLGAVFLFAAPRIAQIVYEMAKD